MEISIFAKRRQTQDGRQFFQYLTTLPRRDGTDETMRVCFRDCDPPSPTTCPRNITIEKRTSNISVRRYTDPRTEEIKSGKTLWLSAWGEGSEYVDHSMDDYDI